MDSGLQAMSSDGRSNSQFVFSEGVVVMGSASAAPGADRLAGVNADTQAKRQSALIGREAPFSAGS